MPRRVGKALGLMSEPELTETVAVELVSREQAAQAFRLTEDGRPRFRSPNWLSPEEVHASADLIQWVAQQIALEPEHYDQYHWCGTNRCLAGYAIEALVSRELILGEDENSAWLVIEGTLDMRVYMWIDAARIAMVTPSDGFAATAGPLKEVSVPAALGAIADELRKLTIGITTIYLSECHEVWWRHWGYPRR